MYLYGASGHAKVVIDILKCNGQKVIGLFDDNVNVKELSNIKVSHSYKGEEPLIITIGDCKIRKIIAERTKTNYGIAIHPSAIISENVEIGEGSVIMQGAIIQTDCVLGKHCIVNTKASLDHECILGDFVHIAPGATLSGNVKVGECTWIGVGATVIQGIKIGKNCMIGAGAVVIRDIPDNAVVAGVPAKVIKMKD